MNDDDDDFIKIITDADACQLAAWRSPWTKKFYRNLQTHSMATHDPVISLPIELFTSKILIPFLTVDDLVRCTLVSKQWAAGVGSDHVWKEVGTYVLSFLSPCSSFLVGVQHCGRAADAGACYGPKLKIPFVLQDEQYGIGGLILSPVLYCI